MHKPSGVSAFLLGAALLAIGVLPATALGADSVVAPRRVSEVVRHDSDDPAIWINRADPAQSLVLGTDKDADGALYVFDLQGRVVADKVVRGLLRPNNVDVAYDVVLGGRKVDVAMLDCQVAILENAIARYFSTGQVPGPLGARHPSITPFEAFRTPMAG